MDGWRGVDGFEREDDGIDGAVLEETGGVGGDDRNGPRDAWGCLGG